MIEPRTDETLMTIMAQLARIEAVLEGLAHEISIIHRQIDRVAGGSYGYGRSGEPE